jgi:hypothetical protein
MIYKENHIRAKYIELYLQTILQLTPALNKDVYYPH